jgi:hypothetical protein
MKFSGNFPGQSKRGEWVAFRYINEKFRRAGALKIAGSFKPTYQPNGL